MKKRLFSVMFGTLLFGTLSFGQISNAEVLSETTTQNLSTISLNSRAVTSYVFNHRPPIVYKGKQLFATQYLGQGQFRGYYK